MMTVFDRISAVFAAKKTPAADALERLLDEARRHLAGCEAALEVLEASRAEAVLGGDETRLAFRTKLSAAAADVDDARLAVEEIERRLIARRDADEQGRRLRAYERAQAARDAAASTLQREYPDIAERFLVVLKAVAEADRLVEAANAELPAGFSELTSTEWTARVGGHRPQRVVDDRTVTLWRAPGSDQPLPPELQEKVEVEPGSGRGFIRRATTLAPPEDPSVAVQRREVHYATSFYELAEFRRIEFIEGRNGDVAPLLREIELPALRGNEAPFWRALPAWAEADHVLRELAAREAERAETVPVPEPRRVVRFELVKDDAPNAEQDDAA